jgi:2-(1,2-epoxy-1,2-dihydrophenyl)acetyl-CoA isomerase
VDTEILVERQDAVAIITLNRPDRFNSFTTNMYGQLPKILTELRTDDDVKAVVLTGAGKGFCSGSDVSARLGNRLENRDTQSRSDTLRLVGAMSVDIAGFDKPMIAAVNGAAVGAGLSVALLCDIRLASEKARFGAVWLNVGLIADLAATYYLPRIVGVANATDLLLTGRIVNADEALKIGLVNKVFPPEELMNEALKLAHSIAAGPSVAIELTKRAIRRSLDNDFKTQLDFETYAQTICRGTEDHKEGVKAFKEKRKPVFKGR